MRPLLPIDLDAALLLRLVLSTLLGVVVGFEREREGKPAGVRTHGLVCLGSALFTIVSASGFGGAGDPARVAAQIVTGIGFLCAGVILHSRGSVHGLTTAASLWVTAAIGTAAGAGMIVLPVLTAILVFTLLRFGPRPGLKAGHPHSD